MIRVLNVISDTNIGGAGRVILNYLRYADSSRFETWAAVPRGSLLKAPLEEAGARVLEVDGMADRSYHREDVKALKELIRRERPDLVHTHGALSGRIAAGSAASRWCTAATPLSRCPPSCGIPPAGGSTSG